MEKERMKICSVLGEGTVIEGDYSTKGAVRLDGIINGNVTIEGVLILGITGKIYGDVVAYGAVVGGEIIGNLEVNDKIELMSSAKLIGDIKTNGIVIDEKAIFQGKCFMNQDESSLKDKTRKNSKRDLRGARRTAQNAVLEALKEVKDEEEIMETAQSMVADE